MCIFWADPALITQILHSQEITTNSWRVIMIYLVRSTGSTARRSGVGTLSPIEIKSVPVVNIFLFPGLLEFCRQSFFGPWPINP